MFVHGYSFCCWNLVKFGTEHSSDTAVLCAKFVKDLAADTDVMFCLDLPYCNMSQNDEFFNTVSYQSRGAWNDQYITFFQNNNHDKYTDSYYKIKDINDWDFRVNCSCEHWSNRMGAIWHVLSTWDSNIFLIHWIMCQGQRSRLSGMWTLLIGGWLLSLKGQRSLG